MSKTSGLGRGRPGQPRTWRSWAPMGALFVGRTRHASAGCWEWQGRCDQYGYGWYSNRRATHVAWFLATGAWPTQQVLHRCDNPRCVRFAHLFEGTQQDNLADMRAKGRGYVPPPGARWRKK